MNNIEKFEKLKELSKLKTELSREMLKSSISLKSLINYEDIVHLGKMLLRNYQAKTQEQE